MGSLDIDQITKKLENSFLPYRCVVERVNWDNDIRLEIYDKKDKLILHTRMISITHVNGFSDEASLSSYIESVKMKIESIVYPLNKSYIKCEFGLTPACTNCDNPVWSKLIFKEIKPGQQIPIMKQSDMDRANDICKSCYSFSESEYIPPVRE